MINNNYIYFIYYCVTYLTMNIKEYSKLIDLILNNRYLILNLNYLVLKYVFGDNWIKVKDKISNALLKKYIIENYRIYPDIYSILYNKNLMITIF